MFELFPRQQEALTTILAKYEQGVTKQLVALPTGVGKTILAAHLVSHFPRTLFLTHTQELLQQTKGKFAQIHGPENVGIYWGSEEAFDCKVTVASLPTVYSRIDRFPKDTAELVIIDECHHAGARTWREILDQLQSNLRVGLTATPERYDGVPLSNLFDEVTYRMTIVDAIRENYVTNIKGYRAVTQTSLDHIKTQGGDLEVKALSNAVNTRERTGVLLKAWKDIASDRKTIGYCVDIQHAADMASEAEKEGIQADYVWGTDPFRTEKLELLREGKLQILFNCELLCEGYDDPAVSCILMARPTRSRTLYTQIVGRGVRKYPGKEDCIVIEAKDNNSRHTLVNVWDFYGLLLNRNADNHLIDLNQALELQEEEHDQYFSNFTRLTGGKLNIEYYLEEIDYLKPPPPVTQPEDYGTYNWHYAPATEKQLQVLLQNGYDIEQQDWTKGQAAHIIDSLPPTPNQVNALLALGYDAIAHDWTRSQAATVLDEVSLQNANWERVQQLFVSGTKPVKERQEIDTTRLPAGVMYQAVRFDKCKHTVWVMTSSQTDHIMKLREGACPICIANRHGATPTPLFGVSPKQISYARTIWMRKLNRMSLEEAKELVHINHAQWWLDHKSKHKLSKYAAIYDPTKYEAEAHLQEPPIFYKEY